MLFPPQLGMGSKWGGGYVGSEASCATLEEVGQLDSIQQTQAALEKCIEKNKMYVNKEPRE